MLGAPVVFRVERCRFQKSRRLGGSGRSTNRSAFRHPSYWIRLPERSLAYGDRIPAVGVAATRIAVLNEGVHEGFAVRRAVAIATRLSMEPEEQAIPYGIADYATTFRDGAARSSPGRAADLPFNGPQRLSCRNARNGLPQVTWIAYARAHSTVHRVRRHRRELSRTGWSAKSARRPPVEQPGRPART